MSNSCFYVILTMVCLYVFGISFDYVGEILPRYMDNSKLKKLGFEFKRSLSDMFKGAVECAVEKGLVAYPGSTP